MYVYPGRSKSVQRALASFILDRMQQYVIVGQWGNGRIRTARAMAVVYNSNEQRIYIVLLAKKWKVACPTSSDPAAILRVYLS